MSEQVLQAAASFIFACDLPEHEIEILWHAGEPMATGIAFYERALELFAKCTPSGVGLRHTIQTNGTLLTQQWCELFAKYNVEVGISVDGPAEIHDISRLTWSGKGTHYQVMKGYRLLRQSGIRVGAICVLTRDSLNWPDRIFDFFSDAGFASIAFNVEESEGVHQRSGLLDLSALEIRALYESFMRRIWQRWRADASVIKIRELREMLGCIVRLQQDPDFVRDPPEVGPFNIITIRRDGGISTFSPELASTPNTEYGNFVLGNVLTDMPSQIAQSDTFAKLHQNILVGQERCRQSCEYYPLCGAAFQSNRLVEHGSFHACETLTCRLQRKTLADVVMDELIGESRAIRQAVSGEEGTLAAKVQLR